MRRVLLIVAAGINLIAGGCSAGSSNPSAASQSPKTEPAIILAVGDIAQCNDKPASESAAAKSAALIDQQPANTPLLLLGDLVYHTGTAEEYRNCYEPTYGKFMPRSYPAPGNHDYGVPGAENYYNYFGARAGPEKRGYYSFDVGSWHIVSLNSNIDMAKGSAQEIWLRADLNANRSKKCTLAYWHHPRFSSSSAHGDDPISSDVWKALFEFKADVVLVGHDHTYERFAPQDPDAKANPAGIRQFVIGTGGAGLYEFGPPKPNSEVRGAGAFGIGKFVLDEGKYSWEFLPVPGSSFTDKGEANCVL
jgi:acid phosphatase type 7